MSYLETLLNSKYSFLLKSLGLLALAILTIIATDQLFKSQRVSAGKQLDYLTVAIHNAFENEEIPYQSETSNGQIQKPKLRLTSTTFFEAYNLTLKTMTPSRFKALRTDHGAYEESQFYKEMLGKWSPVSGLGRSGAKFLKSENQVFFCKSLDRFFEIDFLYNHFLTEYFPYMKANPESRLNKIYSLLAADNFRLGHAFQVTPAHYIIIENALQNKEDDVPTYDLKPDLLLDAKRDWFNEPDEDAELREFVEEGTHLYLPKAERNRVLIQLGKDLDFLARMQCLDYSILLVINKDGSYALSIVDYLTSSKISWNRILGEISRAVAIPAHVDTAPPALYARLVKDMMAQIIRVKG